MLKVTGRYVIGYRRAFATFIDSLIASADARPLMQDGCHGGVKIYCAKNQTCIET
jgi:hypothetical protein